MRVRDRLQDLILRQYCKRHFSGKDITLPSNRSLYLSSIYLFMHSELLFVHFVLF